MNEPTLAQRIEELEAILFLTREPGQLVDACYQKVLKRKADKVGREFWVRYLEQGGSVHEMVELFRLSPEYKG